MKWTLVKEKLPPIGKDILLGIVEYCVDSKAVKFNWFKTSVTPTKKSTFPERFQYSYRYWTDCEFFELSPFHYWMEIDRPE